MHDAGGDRRTYSKVVRAETQELFDCGVDELYEATGGRKGDRSTLPKEAQKAYMVNETLAGYRLHELEPPSPSASEPHDDHQIVEAVRDTSKSVRRWLPW